MLVKQSHNYLSGVNHLQGSTLSIPLKGILEAIILLNVLIESEYYSMDGRFYLGKWSKVIPSQF